jgi:hypothetical protein
MSDARDGTRLAKALSIRERVPCLELKPNEPHMNVLKYSSVVLLACAISGCMVEATNDPSASEVAPACATESCS